MTLIALTGIAYSGKTTGAAFFETEYGFRHLNFAEPLKKVVDDLFGSLQGLPKEEPVSFYPYESPRKLWQTIGTDALRSFYPDIWVNATLHKIRQGQNIVIGDLRFPNECAAVRSKGGVVIRVNRPSIKLSDAPPHASESYINSLDVDFDVLNSGSLEDYYASLKAIYDAVQSQ